MSVTKREIFALEMEAQLALRRLAETAGGGELYDCLPDIDVTLRRFQIDIKASGDPQEELEAFRRQCQEIERKCFPESVLRQVSQQSVEPQPSLAA